MPGTAGTSDLPPTKTITVYRNGDAFYPGRKIVVNPRQVSTLDSFLTTLTRAVEAPFGAVRRLYTPVRGHKVQHLDDLKHGSVVFTNGDVLVPSARIRIPKYTLRSWENVLALVTEKVHLRTGAVYRLCTLDGHPICGSTELENNQHYVAVGAEKFKALPYDQCVPGVLIRENNVVEGQHVLPPIRKTRHAKDVFAHTGFGEDLEHTARGQMKKHTAKPERTKQQRQVSRNPVLLLTGEGSVFNAQNKRSEMAGAVEVQEDRQLKVDLPIDQVEAKIVEEEYEDG
ncbi:doublecortin domain-containing protein 2C isoform X1, partial [Lates japonicus]